MSGLHFDSLADLPPQMRNQVASKIMATQPKVASVIEPNQEIAEQQGKELKKPQKYRNIETDVAGIRFKSKKEASRYAYLKWLLDRGIIQNLKLQKQYTLQESYITHNGERIRAIRYWTDFTYCVDSAGYDLLAKGVAIGDIEYWREAISQHGSGVEIIEDTKSRPTKTPQYRMKYKMMADAGYHIREV